MSSNLDLIAIIYPKEGKVDRLSLPLINLKSTTNCIQVIELLQGVAVYVKANEPQTLKYEIVRQVNKKSGVEEIIMLESYKDKAALNAHGSSDAFKKFSKTLVDEGLVGAPMELKFVRSVGGFSRL